MSVNCLKSQLFIRTKLFSEMFETTMATRQDGERGIEVFKVRMGKDAFTKFKMYGILLSLVDPLFPGEGE